jgi:hypothetical protein
MRNSRKGQSVVEFIFVVLAFLNLLVVTINATMAFAVQQYMSYAAFMAARAYQASNISPTEQNDAAKAVLSSYLFITPSDASEKVFRFHADSKGTARDVEWEIPDSGGDLPKYGQMPPSPGRRIRIDFKVPLFQLPFGPSIKALNLIWVPLSAVSYLGRESTVEECRKFFEGFYNFYRQGGGPDGWVGMDDNNC